MQETMDRVSQVCYNYDLTIREKNNGVGYSQHLDSPKWSQPSPWPDKDCKLLIEVTYRWGSVYMSAIDDEVITKIVNASVVFSVFCSV